MSPSRRTVLSLGTGLGLAVAAPRMLTAATQDTADLLAREASVQLAPPGYPHTAVWAFDGALPGPVIRVPQGGRVRRRLVNALPQPTSVHWHGVRIDNRMDGVAGLTQPAVEPGGDFLYDFVAPDAGTYWYHAHNRSAEQVARGLYGALVVEEAEGPDVDRDEVLILDDWRLDPETAQIHESFGNPHDRSHAGRYGNYIATNGLSDLSLVVRQGERLRLRLVNAANARIFGVDLDGLAGWVAALDGMPLGRPGAIAETLLLAPGQRADLIVDVTAAPGETARLVGRNRDGGISLAAFPVRGAGGTRRAEPAALPPNPDMAPPSLDETRPLRLVMEGGAMGRLTAATLNGTRQDFRSLARANQFWAFNGRVGMTEAPFAELARGETVRLELVNDTAFPHAMHLHGMHFREILPEGGFGALRDTVTLFRGEAREIVFKAGNPGDWMLHCHMLSHAESGMMTWVRVR